MISEIEEHADGRPWLGEFPSCGRRPEGSHHSGLGGGEGDGDGVLEIEVEDDQGRMKSNPTVNFESGPRFGFGFTVDDIPYAVICSVSLCFAAPFFCSASFAQNRATSVAVGVRSPR